MSALNNETLLGDLVVLFDSLHKTPKSYIDEGYPMIRVTDIKRGSVRTDGTMKVDEKTYEEFSKKYKPEVGDIILSRVGSYGNSAIVTNGEPFCLGQNTVCLSPIRSKVSPHYLYCCLNSRFVLAQFDSFITGASQPTISLKNIRTVRIPLPPIKIQRRVSQVISAYDDLIENNRRRIQLLEQAARLLYKEWFVHLRFPGHEHTPIIDGVPEGWEKKPLGAIAPLKYGKALKKDDRVPGPFPVYGSSGIVGSHSKALVPSPAIIVGRKGNVGSVYWSPDDCHPIDTVYYIDSGNCSFFLYYALQQMTFISTDVAVPGLNRDFAHSRSLLVAEQKILRLFEETVSPLHQQMELLKRQNASLTKARDLLLPKLMNGEVAV
ncbi:MAG: restriction endonuclease subunit S [Acidobacteria bacterium]|mgnify:CR=1 FL=1|nr:restriction endonuclease subunit S [Acidobacteriota bacterium]